MIKIRFFILLALIVSSTLFPLSINIRTFDHGNYTRIVFEAENSFEFRLRSSKTEIELGLKQEVGFNSQESKIRESKLIKRIVHQKDDARSVFKVQFNKNIIISKNFVLERPFRIVFDVVATKESDSSSAPVDPQQVPQSEQVDETVPTTGDPGRTEPEKSPGESKKNAIETICIDPGHGGSDLGAIGRSKLLEKNITLVIAKKLKNLISAKLGLRVIMTREKDTEVSLNSRASIANNQKADIFVSIHVNSSFRRAARGPETYFVSLKATDNEAFELAEKENKSLEEINELAPEDDDLRMILWNMAQTEHIKESSKLAEFIQSELNVLMHTRNRGVKQAPFRVLMRAAMPAVLVEVAFISNSNEERKLSNQPFLNQIADAIYDGINKYIYYHQNAYQ